MSRPPPTSFQVKRDWVKADGKGLDVDHIRSRYGASKVTVHDCGRGQVKGMGALASREMTVASYLDEWSRGKTKLLYLKDWNFAKVHVADLARAHL